MTPAALRNLVAYSCALSLMAACAWFATLWTRGRSPRLLLAHFQVTLLVGVSLPLLALFQSAQTAGGGLLPMVTTTGASEAANWSARSSFSVAGAVVVATGIVLRLAWLATGCLRLRTWRLAAKRLDLIPEAIATIEQDLGVRARWFVSNQMTSAATYGIWRPIVLLPAHEVCGPASTSTLKLVVRHELLHVKRRDWLFVVAEEFVLAALWFEPAVWFLIDRIRLCREQVVDEAVVHATKESQNYARALVAGAGLDWVLGSPRPASQWSRSRHLRERIQAIMNGGTMSTVGLVKWTSIFAATLIVACYSAVHAFPLQGSGASRNETRVYNSKDEGVTLPELVSSVKPLYTQEALDAHITGIVKVSSVVEADGTVGDVQITESLDPTFGLDEQAVKAVRQWRFHPGTKDGKAVAVRVEIQLTFTLK